MEEISMKKILVILSILILSVSILSAQGQKDGVYPAKPITIVVPYGAGGDTDLNARMLAQALEKELNVPVIVQNMNGASGTIATAYVKDEAEADGYTVLFNHSNTLINYMTGLTDFTYTDFNVAGIAVSTATSVWAVPPTSKYTSIQDVVKDAKNRPGKVVFPVLTAATTHMQALDFEKVTGTKLNIVDIGGTAEKLQAFLSGSIDILTAEYGSIQEHIKAGTMVPLGIFADERNPLFPEVPTFKEQGVDVSQVKIFFFSFPKETPQERVTTFTQALERVVKSAEFKAKADEYMTKPDYSNPADSLKRLAAHAQYFEQFKTSFK
ncbi:MAG: tripartite tricarboxylate transporter substrate binding protein [Spirochaetia bacterium]|nr:tripartite tricarboxylate transporter substrate binding protein [Spirochaetia bacterium]